MVKYAAEYSADSWMVCLLFSDWGYGYNAWGCCHPLRKMGFTAYFDEKEKL